VKILATIAIGFAVLIAALLFLSFSLCAASPGIHPQGRATLIMFALGSLAVMIGGILKIGALHKSEKSQED